MGYDIKVKINSQGGFLGFWLNLPLPELKTLKEAGVFWREEEQGEADRRSLLPKSSWVGYRREKSRGWWPMHIRAPKTGVALLTKLKNSMTCL